MPVYLEAKIAADQCLMKSKLDWTIIRPGLLTEEPPTGRIAAGKIHLQQAITRSDVAAVVAVCIKEDYAIGMNIDVLNGEIDITQEIKRVCTQRETTMQLS